MSARRGVYCRGCMYDLRGACVPAGEASSTRVCPECGRAFDAADPATTFAWPRPWWWRAATSRVGRSALLLAVLLPLFYATWLPRPVTTDWSMWEWMHRRYGAESGWAGRFAPGAAWVRRTYWAGDVTGVSVRPGRDAGWSYTVERRGGGRWRVRVGAGAPLAYTLRTLYEMGAADGAPVRVGLREATAASAPVDARGDALVVTRALLVAADSPPTYRVERLGPDEWTLEAAAGVAGWREVIGGMNDLRDSLYGVRILGAGRESLDQGLRVRGTEADLFWALYNAYELRVSTLEPVPPRSDGWRPPPGDSPPQGAASPAPAGAPPP